MKKIEDLISEILDCDISSLPETTPFKEVELWDSLKHVTLIIGIETILQIKLDAEDIKQMTSLANIKRILKEKNINE
jgi:acyl carrier protein